MLRDKWAARVRVARADDAATWRGLSAGECEDIESESGLVDDAARCTHFGVRRRRSRLRRISVVVLTRVPGLCARMTSGAPERSCRAHNQYPPRQMGSAWYDVGRLALLDGLEAEGRRINEQLKRPGAATWSSITRLFPNKGHRRCGA